TAAGDPYLVMELLSGETLAAHIEASPPRTLTDIARLGVALLEPLAAAHAKGFVHRDLKPDNVFLARPSGALKLLDFGIAKGLFSTEGGGTATSALMGTPRYMSPEQLRSAKNVDFRTDLWAVGIIVYEMATGAVPFLAEGLGELLLSILGGQM